MMVVWLIVGIAAVTAAFFIPGSQNDLWPHVNTAGVVAAVYLLGLLAYALRKPISFKARIVAWVVFLVWGVASFSAWRTMDEMSHWQRNELLKILETISRGVLSTYSEEPLLQTLKSYHQQAKKSEPLGKIFQRVRPDAKVGMNIHKPLYEGDSTAIYVSALTDTQIVLVGRVGHAKGRNPEFRNYDGRKGMLEECAILTQRGVVYESAN